MGLYTPTYLLLPISRQCNEALPTLHKTRIHCFPPAVLGTFPPFRQPLMGPVSHRYVFFEHCATLKGETLESGMCD